MRSEHSNQADSEHLGRKVTKGVGWNYLSYGLGKTISLITISILAHLLSPDDFGVVALATLAIEYLSILNDFGLATALIQRRENLEEASNVVFTLNLIISFSLTLLTYLLAPRVALFFNEPSLTPILRWLGLIFSINAFGSVHKARLQREMHFGRKVIPELGNTIIKGVVSIGFAIKGYGAWSLVYGQLAGLSVSIILLWIVVPWMPSLVFRSGLSNQLFNFGIPIMADRALSILGDSFDYFVIGRFFDSAALGIYTLAYRLPELLVITTLTVLAGVIFPAYASIQNQPNELRKRFLQTIKYVQLLITPMCLGMIVAADLIIKVVFGEQWLDAIPIMQILSLYCLILSIGYHVGDVYKAIGRPDILIKLSVPIFIIRIIAIWVGAQYSLIGVAYGHLIASMFELILRTIVAIRVVKISLLEITKQLTAFIGGAVLLALTIPTLYITSEMDQIIRLILVVVVGALGYLGTIWIIERESLKRALKIIGLKSPINSLKN